jgi:hypothetical protein
MAQAQIATAAIRAPKVESIVDGRARVKAKPLLRFFPEARIPDVKQLSEFRQLECDIREIEGNVASLRAEFLRRVLDLLGV